MSWSPIFILWLLVLSSSFVEAARFQAWFGGLEDYFQDKLQSSCRNDYEAYLSQAPCPSCQVDWPSGGSDYASIAVINCLLKNSEEYVKANLAVGSIILGSLPTVLSFSGSSTVEVGLLALRRPLLAGILAVTCPSLYPLRAVDLDNIDSLLRAERMSSGSNKSPSNVSFRTISILEYVLALGAAVNTGTQIWALCVKSASALGPELVFWPLFWPATTFFMHILGTLHASLRAEIVPGNKSLRDRLVREFSPCASQLHCSTATRPLNHFATILAWILAVLTIVHVVYGTTALSSLLFIPVSDAAFIGLRFVASAGVTRTIIDYELSGMKHARDNS